MHGKDRQENRWSPSMVFHFMQLWGSGRHHWCDFDTREDTRGCGAVSSPQTSHFRDKATTKYTHSSCCLRIYRSLKNPEYVFFFFFCILWRTVVQVVSFMKHAVNLITYNKRFPCVSFCMVTYCFLLVVFLPQDRRKKKHHIFT